MPRIGQGRPRVRPDRIRADKAYASRSNRAYLRRRGIRCTIPGKADQARTRQKPALAAAGRRALTRLTTASAMRSSAGSTDSRETAVATRYDKLAVRYEATVLVSAINEWL